MPSGTNKHASILVEVKLILLLPETIADNGVQFCHQFKSFLLILCQSQILSTRISSISNNSIHLHSIAAALLNEAFQLRTVTLFARGDHCSGNNPLVTHGNMSLISKEGTVLALMTHTGILIL